MGGGVVVDHQPKGRHKRFDDDVLRSLESLLQGSPTDILLEAALGLQIASIKEIVSRSRLEAQVAQEALQDVLKQGSLIQLEGGELSIDSNLLATPISRWNIARNDILQAIDTYHKTYSLRRGMPREELKSKLKFTQRSFNAIINKLVADGAITEHSAFLAKVGHEIQFNGQEQAKVQTLMRKFDANRFGPPSVKECQADVGEEVVNALIELGELVAVSSDVLFRKADYDLIESNLRKEIIKNGQISLAEVRDLFQTSRKYAQALLEHFDAVGVTIRDGDYRKLRK
ncbi:MAG: SelB C-terminal domain-containing protein [Anaerolineales bacterium]|nr:SelB C-terminal domain-containing protein [Anaerolineales bacterium]